MAVRGGLQKARVDRLDLPEPNIFINSDGFAAVAVVSSSLSSNIATLVLAKTFYWVVGDEITVAGISPVFDGNHVITSVDQANKVVSYAKTNDNVASADAPAGAKVYRKEALAYFARYKVTSNQGESAWSGVHRLYANYWFRRPSGTTVNTGLREAVINSTVGKIVSLSWDPIDLMIDDTFIRKPEYYDVWLQWYKGNDPVGTVGKWIYEERVQGTSMTFNVPANYTRIETDGSETTHSGPNRLMVEVRLRGNPVIRQRQIGWNPDVFEDTTYLLAYETATAVSV